MPSRLKYIFLSVFCFIALPAGAVEFTTRPESPLAVTDYIPDAAEAAMIRDIETRSELIFSGQTEIREGLRLFYFKATPTAAHRILLAETSTDKIQSDLKTLQSTIELKGELKVFTNFSQDTGFTAYFPQIADAQIQELAKLTDFKTEFIHTADRYRLSDKKTGASAELFPNQIDLAIEDIKTLGIPEIIPDGKGLMDAFKYKSKAEQVRIEKAKKILMKAFCEKIF